MTGRTIVGQYHVFGSGSGWVNWVGDAEKILRFRATREYNESRRDDGDNGFYGTYSVETHLFPPGISTDPGFDPGSGGTTGRTFAYVKGDYLERKFSLPHEVAVVLALEKSSRWLLATEDVMQLWAGVPRGDRPYLLESCAKFGIQPPQGVTWMKDLNFYRDESPARFINKFRASWVFCYRKNGNPIPLLRRVFPEYEIEFTRQKLGYVYGEDYGCIPLDYYEGWTVKYIGAITIKRKIAL